MIAAAFSPLSVLAARLEVGPQAQFRLPSEAIAQAHDGDVVEIAAGRYEGDVAVITQKRLTLRGVGGMAELVAKGHAAEGKAIWVLRGGDIVIDHVAFSGARVADRNGAGIRLEAGSLHVSDSRFLDNENGILTSAGPDIRLFILRCELGNNGDGSGYSHDLYAGRIARLEVRDSYFHHARGGHLLKSRAQLSVIVNNRLADGEGGRASYELEFPDGGLAWVEGNLIEQSAQTSNPVVFSVGAESWMPGVNRVYLVRNLFINRAGSDADFVRMREGGELIAYDNSRAGSGRWQLPRTAREHGSRKQALPSAQQVDWHALLPAASSEVPLLPADALSFAAAGATTR